MWSNAQRYVKYVYPRAYCQHDYIGVNKATVHRVISADTVEGFALTGWFPKEEQAWSKAEQSLDTVEGIKH